VVRVVDYVAVSDPRQLRPSTFHGACCRDKPLAIARHMNWPDQRLQMELSQHGTWLRAGKESVERLAVLIFLIQRDVWREWRSPGREELTGETIQSANASVLC
jgi:hypothetical protein